MTGVSVATLVAVGCGIGVAVGLLLILSAVRGVTRDPAGSDSLGSGAGPRPGRLWWRPGTRSQDHATAWGVGSADIRAVAVRVVGVVVAAVVVGVVTRWLVAAVLAGVAVWALPRLLGAEPGERARVARIEAIAAWTEMLRDILSAAAGLEQAIIATAQIAPEAIRPQVQSLAEDLTRGRRLSDALRDFADDIADPSADLVVAALVLAAEHQAKHLADLLASLAVTARERAGMRLRVGAGRARTRTSVRIIIGVTLAMAAGLVVLNRGYLSPYDTAVGQLVLLVVGLIFVVALVWVAKIAQVTDPARVLTGVGTQPAPGHRTSTQPSANGGAPLVRSPW